MTTPKPSTPSASRIYRPLKWVFVTLAVVLLLVGFNRVFPMVWYSPQIDARVAARDDTPLAGAIVVASWNITGSWNGASLGQLAIAEVVTDKDGKFTIPAWGPRFHFRGAIIEDEPTVRIFKPGFAPLIIRNTDEVPMHGANAIIKFRFQDQTVTLNQFKGAPGDYEASLLALEDGLRAMDWNVAGEVYDEKRCYWRQTPRLLLALEQEKSNLAAQGLGKSLRTAVQQSGGKTELCGDAEQFFRDAAALPH